MDKFNGKNDFVRDKKQDEKYRSHSKRRLSSNIKKKFETTVIGSLDILEKSFGDLWGHGKPFSQLTDEEIYWRKIWEGVRTEIMDLGFSNLRNAQSEINNYTIDWNRYVTVFKFKGEEE